MLIRGIACAGLIAVVALQADAAERMRFWNLTTVTISHLQMAPAGTTNWGPDQCKNDPDGTVDHDERLNLTGIKPGKYDVKLVDKKGRMCTVSGVDVVGGKPYAFSISDKDLTNCTK